MQNVRKQLTVPALAIGNLIIGAIWYAALILNLRHLGGLDSASFFWTAALGVGPFVCLALTAWLTEAYFHTNDPRLRPVVLASLTVGLSPWIWWSTARFMGLN